MKKFKVKGSFWLPNKPEVKLSGELVFHPTKGISLEVIASHSDSMHGKQIIMHGITLGKKLVTLIDCIPLGKTVSSYGIEIIRYSALYIVQNVLFDDINEIKFDSMRVEYAYLDEWINHTPYTLNLTPQDGIELSTVDKSKVPSDVINIAGNKLSLTNNVSVTQRWIGSIIEIVSKWFVEFTFEEEYSFKEYLTKFLVPMQNFLALATGKTVLPKSVEARVDVVYSDGTKDKVTIELYYSFGQTFRNQPSFNRGYALFLYDDIRDVFTECVEQWFGNYELLNEFHALYFETIYNPFITWRQAFLNLARALELFHRQEYGGKYVTESDFAEIYNALVGAIPKETDKNYREALKQRLQYQNEYSLRKRLRILIDQVRNVLGYYLPETLELVAEIADYRNYLTHLSEDLKERATQIESRLPKLVYYMELIVQVYLLRKLNIPEDRYATMLERRISLVQSSLNE